MSKKISIVMTDDIDGAGNAEPVIFVFDGVMYEIDLSEANRATMSHIFAPFIEAGRRVAGGRYGGARRTEPSAIRAWARENGLEVSERGRLSDDLVRQYEAAH